MFFFITIINSIELIYEFPIDHIQGLSVTMKN